MNITAVLLVTAGAFALAFYHILSKHFQMGEWKNRSAMVSALGMGGSSVMLLAYSFATGGPQLSAGWLFPVIASGTLNIGIMFAKTRARALEDVSLVTPIDSTTPALVIITAMVIVGEYPTTLGWIGIWILVVGTYVLNIHAFRQQSMQKQTSTEPKWKKELRVWFAPFLALNKSAGIRWAFLAVLLSTFSLPYDGLTARRADVGFGFAMICAIAALGNIALALARQEHKGVKIGETLKRTIALGATFAACTIFTGLAYRLSLVAYIGTLKRLTIPMTIILAFLFLGERKSFRQRIVGGTIMAIGAVIIALAK